MSNTNIFNFIGADSITRTNSFDVLPVYYPLISGSSILTADVISNLSAPVTLSLTNNLFKVEYNEGFVANTWYINVSGSNMNLISGSQYTGSVTNVAFDPNNFISQPLSVTSIDISPVNKSVMFNGNFVVNDTIFVQTDSNGLLTQSLVPQPYNVTIHGNKKNTVFQIYPTGSKCNAKDVIVSGYNSSAVITPYNSASLSYTAQVTDNRYVLNGGFIASASFSATSSIANSASVAVSSSYAVTSSFSLNAVPTVSASWSSASLSSSWAPFQVSSSYSVTASNSISSSYVKSVTSSSWASASLKTVSSSYAVNSDTATNSTYSQLLSNTLVQIDNINGIYVGTDLEISSTLIDFSVGGHSGTINLGNGGSIYGANTISATKFQGNADTATSSSYAYNSVTSSLANTASYVTAGQVVIQGGSINITASSNTVSITAGGTGVNAGVQIKSLNPVIGDINLTAGYGNNGGNLNLYTDSGQVNYSSSKNATPVTMTYGNQWIKFNAPLTGSINSSSYASASNVAYANNPITLLNGGFESGSFLFSGINFYGWQQVADPSSDVTVTSVYSHSGTASLRLIADGGAFTINGTNDIEQVITVPLSASFQVWYNIPAANSTSSLDATFNGVSIGQLPTTSSTGGWLLWTGSLYQYANQTGQLKFTYARPAVSPTGSIYLDDIAVVSAYTSSYAYNSVTSSYSLSASWSPAPASVSGSWASSSLSSSYSVTASYSLNAIPTVSASWASASISSSYLNGNHTGSTFGTASWSVNSVSASYSVTASFANVVISGSWSSASLSSSWAPVPISASWASSSISSSFLNGNHTGSTFGTASNSVNSISSSYSVTASYSLSASWAPGGGSSVSASWASSSLSSSYITFNYITLVTGSTNWITASFTNYESIVNLTTGSNYNFTCSNLPANPQVTATSIFINNTAAATSSLAFPSNWIFLGSVPTSITASKSAILSLKAYGSSSIIAGFSIQY